MAIKRFAASSGSGSGNWIRAGKSVANEAAGLFETATAYGNDYGGMARAYMDSQSSQRKAATKAQTAVYKQGLAANAQVTNSRTKADADTYVNKVETKSKMAGKLAAYGGTLAKGFQKKEPPAPPAQVDSDAVRALEREIYGDVDTPVQTDDTPPSESAPVPEPTVDRPSPPSSGEQAAYTAPAAGKIYTKGELEALAVQGGFSQDQAPLVAQIAMGESGGDPTAFNGEGRDQSYGIMQINMLGDMGPERRQQFGISSNEQLNDPLTNMRAAHAIYQQQGWGAWGAYTNGSYANH